MEETVFDRVARAYWAGFHDGIVADRNAVVRQILQLVKDDEPWCLGYKTRIEYIIEKLTMNEAT